MVILNSPQLLSKKYLSWRILRSPGAWAPAYIERAKYLRQYKSAILFPEQVLPIAGAGLYEVHVGSDNSTDNPNRETRQVQVRLCKLSNCRIELGGFKGTPTVQDIYDWEHENDAESDQKYLFLLTMSNSQPFLDHFLFSGKRDALAFAKKQLGRISD